VAVLVTARRIRDSAVTHPGAGLVHCSSNRDEASVSDSGIHWPSRLGAVTAVLMAFLLAAACASSGGTDSSGGSGSAAPAAGSAAASGKTISVGYLLAAPVSALEAIGNGIKKESAALGMNFQQISANFSADQQVAGMQALEAKHVDVIISAPLVPASFFQAAQTASSQGIHVLTYNKAGPGVTYAVTNPDTQEANSIVGVLARHLRSEGKQCDIGIIEGQPTAPPLLARDTGFTAGAKAANCTVLASQVATQTTAGEGSSIANSWKTRFGSKMTGIVVINDDVALGVLPVRGGQFSPEVVSLNGEPAAVAAVQNGSMYADAGLENAVMGESLAIVAQKVATGQSVPAAAESPYFLITKATAGKFNQTYADATVLGAAVPGKVSFSQNGGKTILNYAP
jgi:ABC-type sugar transport system substrate-binding protein